LPRGPSATNTRSARTASGVPAVRKIGAKINADGVRPKFMRLLRSLMRKWSHKKSVEFERRFIMKAATEAGDDAANARSDRDNRKKNEKWAIEGSSDRVQFTRSQPIAWLTNTSSSLDPKVSGSVGVQNRAENSLSADSGLVSCFRTRESLTIRLRINA